MSLKHAVLGFLNYAPKSGYDLKGVFDVSVRHFWPADQSQIYRTLAQLSKEKLVEMKLVEQESRPDRKVYRITPAGRKELRRWLAMPVASEEPRSAALIQVFFADLLPDKDILPMFERGADYLRKLLEHYEQVPQDIERLSEAFGSPRAAFFWSLTLESGVAMARSQLEWMESVIYRLRAGEAPAAPKAKPKTKRRKS